MPRMERRKLATLIQSLGESLNKKINDLLMETYLEVLADISEELLKPAIIGFLADGRMPAPNDIKRKLGLMPVDSAQNASMVVAELECAIGRYGWPNEAEALAALSPASQAIVRGRGWFQTCCDLDDLYDRNRRFKIWQAMAKHFYETGSLAPQACRQIEGEHVAQLGEVNGGWPRSEAEEWPTEPEPEPRGYSGIQKWDGRF